MLRVEMKNLVVFILVLGLAASSGLAAEMVIDFEPPTYSIGYLSGQEYWTGGDNGCQVQNSTVLSGSQSSIGGLSSSWGMITRPLSQDNLHFQDGYTISYLVRQNVDGSNGMLRLDHPTSSGYTDYVFVQHDVRNTCNVIRVNNQKVGTPGYFTVGETHLITLVLDFTNQSIDVIDKEIVGDSPGNIVTANDIPFGSATTPSQADIGCIRLQAFGPGSWYTGANQVIDDITFAVPEPATIGLLSLGLGFLIRRRK